MLKSIKIKNFRSLKNFNMEFNSGLNVIIGENDAGKTSLIDSLKILFMIAVFTLVNLSICSIIFFIFKILFMAFRA